MTEKNVQEFKLAEDCELRFEVGGSEDVVLELVEGSAEIFGSSLDTMKKYAFPPKSRVAVFTWKGCELELAGETTSAYIAEHTPMVIYLNTHAAIEQNRQYLEDQRRLTGDGDVPPKGPRLMLVGPTDVGKSTLCRILCNYSVRQGRSPIFIDLDVGQNSISVPGTIGALFINKTADIVEGFDRSKPLIYSFGHNTPSGNKTLYEKLVRQLADVVSERCKTNYEASIGGMVINTCGWVHGEGYDCLVTAASAFEVDVVVVLDHERLFNDLQKDLPSFVKILHQPKSGGVETRSQDMRNSLRTASIHRYFYGTRSNQYFPFTFELPLSEVMLCKIGAEKLPDSCLPFGVTQDDHMTKVVSLSASKDMIHRLFAVSPCPSISQQVYSTPCLGFVCIAEMNLEDKIMTILSPQNSLPSKAVLVWTDIKFVDDQTRRDTY